MENIKLENLTLIEFLELISGYNEIKEYTIKINLTDTKTGKVHEPLEVTGRIKDFKELNPNLPQLESFIQNLENENNHSYTEIEIYNYLKKLTDNFSNDEVKIILNEMEVFENMELFEEMNEISELEYIRNGWEMPLVEYKNIMTKKFDKIPNYKVMRNKVFPYLGWNFYRAKGLLNDKLKKDNNLVELQKFELQARLISLRMGNKILDYEIKEIEKKLECKEDINSKITLLIDYIKTLHQSQVSYVPIDEEINAKGNATKNLIEWLNIELDFWYKKKEFEKQPKQKNIQDELWFKVGLFFATGVIPMEKKMLKLSVNQIAKNLGNTSFRPYINQSINHTHTKGDKNIFLYNDKLLDIYNHCIKNKIPIVKEFQDKIQFD